MYNIILFIVLAISYRFIPYSIPCPDCVCPKYEVVQVIEEKIIYQKVEKQENICLDLVNNIVIIRPCYSLMYEKSTRWVINNITNIDRTYLDSIGVPRNPILRLEVPVNIKFDNSFAVVYFFQSANQYYFPNVINVPYIKHDNPASFIKKLRQFSNVCHHYVDCAMDNTCSRNSYGNTCVITDDPISYL